MPSSVAQRSWIGRGIRVAGEARIGRPGTLAEEVDGLGRGVEAGDDDDAFSRELERLAGGHEDGHARATGEQPRPQLGDGLEGVVAIVEDEEEAPMAELASQGIGVEELGEAVHALLDRQAERRPDDGCDISPAGGVGQVAEPGAVREVRAEFGRGLDGRGVSCQRPGARRA